MSPRVSIRLLAAQSDQRLVTLVNEGHERAFEALVQRYRRPLLRYCRRMGLSDARAEDVLQHALLQAWLSLARGTEVRDLKPWLYRVVHNAAVNAMRGACENHGELTDAMHAEAAVAGESDLERKIAVREALTDVAALPQMQRQAIFLTAVDGQSHDEVASALGISHGALRGLLYRARATLRSAAAALTPQFLIDWATSGTGTAGPTAERLAELSAGGGAAGITGLLLKGAVVAVTAGAVASGAAVVDHHNRANGRPTDRGSLVGNASSAGAARSTAAMAFPASLSALRTGAVEDSSAARHRGSGHGEGGSGHGNPRRGRDLGGSGHESPAGSNTSGRRGGGEGRADDVADIKGDGAASGSGGQDGKGASGKRTSGKSSHGSRWSEAASSGGGYAVSSSGGSADVSTGSTGSTNGASSTDGTGKDQTAAADAEAASGGKGGKGSSSDG